jgi:hypothetical protein
MKPATAPRSELLKQAQHAFSEHLRGRGKRSPWPKRLQQMAVSAVASGHRAAVVGRALGVSGKSVGNWCRQARADSKPFRSLSSPAPTELKVVAQRQAVPVMTAPVPLVRILFRGGACLECPVSALSAELVAALNGGGS